MLELKNISFGVGGKTGEREILKDANLRDWKFDGRADFP